MKRYKNKDIRSKYSVEFWFMVSGMVLSILSILLIVYGLFATVRVMKARCPYEEVLESYGRHAGQVATFEIVEEPVWVGKATRADYYLVTDGSRYIISEMKKSRYEKIRDEVKASGKYDLEGMTLIIADKDERNEVAENVSKELGENINIYNFDDELGDVQLKYAKYNYFSILWTGYAANLIVGGVFLLFCLPMWIENSTVLKNSKQFISLSNITADDVDRAASEAEVKWYDGLYVCGTKTMLVGFRVDHSQEYKEQIAFKYDEIRRIYSVTNLVSTGGTAKKEKVKTYVEAADGNKYILSDTDFRFSMDGYAEVVALFEDLKEIAPHVIQEPADARYEVFRYPFFVPDSDSTGRMAEGAKAYELASDYLIEMVWRFEQHNPASDYEKPEEIFSMKIAFTQTGFAEITVGYFAEFENDIKANMDEFLRRELREVWDECMGEDEVVVFCEK